MRVVNIIYNGDLKEIQGINKVTESLIRGRDRFAINGIDLQRVITNKQTIICSEYKESIIGNNLNTIKQKTSRKARVLLKNLNILRNKYGDALKIYLNFIKPAKEAISNYSNQNLHSDVLIFQDIFSAYYYQKHSKGSVKSILILHGTEEPWSQLILSYPNIKNTIFEHKLNQMLSHVLLNVNKVVFVSKQPIIEMKKKYDSDFEYIYNGIEDIIGVAERKYDKSEKLKFVIVGSVNGRKGQKLLVEAVTLLPDKYKNRLEINIVGSGSDLEEIKNKVEILNLESNFVFWGDRIDVAEILNSMDIYILPSENEALPISIIEAMRAGLPIVATPVGGIPEMIDDNINGILIKRNPEAVAEVIMNFIDGKVNLKNMGEMSRKQYETLFHIDAMISKYAYLLNSL